MNIYLITVDCDDTYYPAHPTRTAFTTLEEAKQYIKSIENDDDSWFPYNIMEITVYDTAAAAQNNYLKKQA